MNVRRYAAPTIGIALMLYFSGCARGGPTKFETVGKAPSEMDRAIFRLHVSPNARHVAWLSKSGPAYTVTLDGVPGKTYNMLSANESFSHDGEHFVYVAGTKRQQFLVVDQKETPYDGRIENPIFSPDSSQVAYAVKTDRTGRGNSYTLFIAGPAATKVIPATDSQFAFSPDGKHFAYCGGADFQHEMLIVDGVDHPIDGRIKSIVFGPDGKRVACVLG